MTVYDLDSKQVGALVGTAIFWQCLADDRTWKCSHCGYDKNWIATEFCEQCHVEDCGQGDTSDCYNPN